jgi:DNA-binding transcriptional LysR family regulator
VKPIEPPLRRLVEVLADGSHVESPISVVYPSRRFLPARTRLFMDALVAHFGKAASQLPVGSVPVTPS